MSKQSINQAISEAKKSTNMEIAFNKTERTTNIIQSSKIEVNEEQSNQNIFTIGHSQSSIIKSVEQKEGKFSESPIHKSSLQLPIKTTNYISVA